MPQPRHTQTLWQSLLHSFIFRRLPGVLLGLILGFGIFLSAQAQEIEACAFGLLACDEQGIVWDIPVSGADNVAQLGGNDGLIELITAFGFFLNRQIVPLLFAFAFLFFLYYLARFFVLDRSKQNDRDEAKQRALWGLGAFVFFVSIWGIVNLFVIGLGFDDSRSLCPDYVGDFCRDIELRGGSNNPFSGSSGGSGGGVLSIIFGLRGSEYSASESTTTGGFIVFNPDNSDGSTNTVRSGLAELIFGGFADQASFNFVSGPPRAANNVITLDPGASCLAGIRTLQTSAQVESLQAAYTLRRTTDGQTVWENLTDSTNVYSVTFDADHLRLSEPAGTNRIALIHTHPQAATQNARLATTGYGPSVNDFELMCDDVENGAQYVTIDANNVWLTESTGVTCPRRSVAEDNLPVISVLLQLAVMDPNTRNDELATVLEAEGLNPQVRSTLRDYRDVDLRTRSSAELILDADNLARAGAMRVRRLTPEDFCAQFLN